MAHNDHLKEPLIEKAEGEAKGVFYKGLAITGKDIIVIARNVDVLREAWTEISKQPLNESGVVPVGVFAQQDIHEG